MNLTNNHRILLYLFLCIPIRSIPIFILSYTDTFNLLLSLLYLLLGLSLLFRATMYNENQKGFFGGMIWWQNLRVFHAICYLLVFTTLVMNRPLNTKKIIIMDLISSLFFFIKHHS